MSKTEMVYKYEKLIYKIVRLMLRRYPRGSFEDLVQEAYIMMFDLRRTYNPQKSKFGTYLFNHLVWKLPDIIKNKSSVIQLNAYTKRIKSQEEINNLVSPVSLHLIPFSDRAQSVKLDKFMLYTYLKKKLTIEEFNLCIYAYIEEYNITDLAYRFNMAVLTVNNHLKKIQKKLKKDKEFYILLGGVKYNE
jgi:RNA polymerase sigma factor (sigma-70 family)